MSVSGSHDNLMEEIDRLTIALHTNRCHPDYLYFVVTIENSPMLPWEKMGYEHNTEYQAAPGEKCWRRRKETT